MFVNVPVWPAKIIAEIYKAKLAIKSQFEIVSLEFPSTTMNDSQEAEFQKTLQFEIESSVSIENLLLRYIIPP